MLFKQGDRFFKNLPRLIVLAHIEIGLAQKKVDISKRKEDERLKEVVMDNLEKYRDYVLDFIEKLELFEKKEHSDINRFVNEINKIIMDFQSRSKFPMNILKSVLQKMLGKDLEQSLQNLKKVLEK